MAAFLITIAATAVYAVRRSGAMANLVSDIGSAVAMGLFAVAFIEVAVAWVLGFRWILRQRRLKQTGALPETQVLPAVNAPLPGGQRRGSTPFDPPWKAYLLGLPTAAILPVVALTLPQSEHRFGGPILRYAEILLAINVFQLLALAATRRFAKTEQQTGQRKGLFLFTLGTLTGTVIGFLVALAFG